MHLIMLFIIGHYTQRDLDQTIVVKTTISNDHTIDVWPPTRNKSTYGTGVMLHTNIFKSTLPNENYLWQNSLTVHQLGSEK